MNRPKLLTSLAVLIVFIFILNFLANKFYWYYTVWHFDMIMHFLGGFWIGLLVLYFLATKVLSFGLVFKTLLIVLVVGIGWEIFEILVNEVVAQNPLDFLDIASDIFFDVTGGVFAILYFSKRIMLHRVNGVHPRIEL